jgi:perosamine synthetase
MTDIQAAIGRAQLHHFSSWQERRGVLVARYDAGLSGVDGIALPARPADGEHAWHLYVVRVLPSFGIDRDALIAELSARGIDCSVHFIPLHQMPYMRDPAKSPIQPKAFPVADRVFPQVLSLPLFPGLLEEEVDRVCAAIADIREAGRSAASSPTSLSPGGEV